MPPRVCCVKPSQTDEYPTGWLGRLCPQRGEETYVLPVGVIESCSGVAAGCTLNRGG